MTNKRLNFSAWQALAKEDPQQLVDKFLSDCELLTPESREAFIAAHPTRDILLQRMNAGVSMNEQPLAGVPYILQDMFDTEGLPTRCGAPFTGPFETPLEDSCLLVQTLASFGANYITKSVPSEFGWDMKGTNHTFGMCPHASGLTYVPGGGAGSCAYGVADGWAPLAFGLDTCAGVRIPAAFHGLYGFRMEHNQYARDGVCPIVPSLDSVGWVTANVEDLLTSFEAFFQCRNHPTDKTPRGYLLADSIQKISAESKSGIMQLSRSLEIDDDPTVNKMLTESFRPAAKSFQTIQNRELYSVHKYWVEEYRSDYDTTLLKRIEDGHAYSPAESEEASQVQQNLRASLMDFFNDYDYLILPISPVASPRRSEWNSTLEEELLELNAPLSLSIFPALFLPYPCGEGKFNAAQVILSPKKLHVVPALLEQLHNKAVSE